MFRFLFQFIAVLIFFAIARKVLTYILGSLLGSFRQNPPRPDPDRPTYADSNLASAGELYRDPVCGTFVPGNSRFSSKADGQTVYFCSAQCRDGYLVSTR